MIKTVMVIVLGVVCDEIEVKTLNRSSAGFFVFSPDFVRIKPGDTISFVAADKGHEVHSVPGMIPDGARPFDGKMSQDLKVTLTVQGIYVIACAPHTAIGHGRCGCCRRPDKPRPNRPERPSRQGLNQTRYVARAAQKKLSAVTFS